ncbi:poly(a)-specific ribonuclease pnldc1 [Anaeramoeba flamelloides]|uniref:Poly(A)-specific ribonuclease pnldc1 n=1 Tax=Anaeramoeba flamelloides TaxID=1746091 RepID=A0ABQ8Y836_9EUKA|nr:poly(a)-specific ribonuclease pnldc1 [Anaeramoeba flamelloides]
MNITSENWEENKDKIIQDFEDCDFIAIDTELTGLHMDWKSFHFSLEDHYKSHKLACNHFVIPQVGFCTFKYDKKQHLWECKPYNIYCFPSTNNRDSSTFTCSVSSLKFLHTHHFDFNTWIGKGVHFKQLEEWEKENKILQQKLEDLKEYFKQDLSLEQIGLSHKPSIAEISKENMQEYELQEFEKIEDEVEKWLLKEDKEYKQVVKSGKMRWMLIQQFLKKCPHVNIETVKEDNENKLKLTKLTKEEFKKIRLQYLQNKIKECRESLGVSELFLHFNKPLIGHNCYFDILHFITSYFCNLPNKLDQCKKVINQKFPIVFDTKTITELNGPELLNGIGIESTSLGDLYQQVKSMKTPKIKFSENFDRYSDLKLAHEAGYDAYMTGTVYLRLIDQLQKDFIYEPNSKLLNPFINKINLCNSFIRRLNLVGEDEKIKHKGMFYVYNFPIAWRNSDIKREFIIEGMEITWKWIDSSSLMLTVVNDEEIEKFKKIFLIKNKENQKKEFKIETFQKYFERKQNEN